MMEEVPMAIVQVITKSTSCRVDLKHAGRPASFGISGGLPSPLFWLVSSALAESLLDGGDGTWSSISATMSSVQRARNVKCSRKQNATIGQT